LEKRVLTYYDDIGTPLLHIVPVGRELEALPKSLFKLIGNVLKAAENGESVLNIEQIS
jgi:hypothetical protein